jgi:hypothetical protein
MTQGRQSSRDLEIKNLISTQELGHSRDEARK